MRSLNLIMLIIILALLLVFIWQNFYTVTISFFKWNMTLPQAIIIAGFYVLGMFTGGLLWSTLKKLSNSKPKTK